MKENINQLKKVCRREFKEPYYFVCGVTKMQSGIGLKLCPECEAKLQTLQEVCEEIEKYCDNLIDTKGERGKITLFQLRGELLKKFQGDKK